MTKGGEVSRSELQALEQYIKDIRRFMPLPFACLTSRGVVIDANEALLEVLGKRDDELIGCGLADIVEPERITGELMSATCQGRAVKDVDCWLRAPGGGRIPTLAYATARHGPGGEYIGCFVSFVDITERRRAQRVLQQSEENLAITLDAIAEAVISTDEEGCVKRMNPVAELLTGWSTEQARGRALSEVFRCVDQQIGAPLEDPWRALRRGASPCAGVTALLRTRGGDERQITCSLAPIRDRSGAVVGMVLVFRDVTRERHLEERLRHAQKMEAVGRLAGGIAHDFNNMLGGIMGYAEMLSLRLAADEQLARYADRIIDTAEKAADLTRKLLAYSRKAKLRAVPVDVKEALRQAVLILRHTLDRRVELRMELSDGALVTLGDPAQLQNAILNLALNARDAMPEGGTLRFRTRSLQVDEGLQDDRLPDLAPGKYLELLVEDSGVGMSPAVLERIFEPFFTTKKAGEGTGLGLAAVEGIVRDHGGAVSVQSDEGVGSRFRIFLPQVEQAPQAAGPAPLPRVAERGARILIIDDEESILVPALNMLQEAGYEVLTASDGEQGLAVFREHAAEIGLVILDLLMPGMHGRDVFRQLKELDETARILVASGFVAEEAAKDLQEAGALGIVQKPYRRAELCQAVEEALGRV